MLRATTGHDTAGLYRRAHDCKEYARAELRESELDLNLCRWQRRLQQMEDRLLRCERQRQPGGPSETSPALARDGSLVLRHARAYDKSTGAGFEAASGARCALSSAAAAPMAQPMQSSLLGSLPLALSADVGLGQAHATGLPALQDQPPTVSSEPGRATSHANVDELHAIPQQPEHARGRSSGFRDGSGSGRARLSSKPCVPEAFAFQMELGASSTMHAVTPLLSPRGASPLPRKSRTPSDSLEGAQSAASPAIAVGEQCRYGLLRPVSSSCEDVAGRASQAWQAASQPSSYESATGDGLSASIASAPGSGTAGPSLLARPIPLCRPVQRHHMYMVSPDEFREIVSSRAELRPCEFGSFGLSPKRPNTAALADAARPHSILLSDDELDALGRWRAARGRTGLSDASASETCPSHRPHVPEHDQVASFGSGSVAGLRNRLQELRAGHDGVRRRTLWSGAPKLDRCWW